MIRDIPFRTGPNSKTQNTELPKLPSLSWTLIYKSRPSRTPQFLFCPLLKSIFSFSFSCFVFYISFLFLVGFSHSSKKTQVCLYFFYIYLPNFPKFSDLSIRLFRIRFEGLFDSELNTDDRISLSRSIDSRFFFFNIYFKLWGFLDSDTMVKQMTFVGV